VTLFAIDADSVIRKQENNRLGHEVLLSAIGTLVYSRLTCGGQCVNVTVDSVPIYQFTLMINIATLSTYASHVLFTVTV